MGEDVAPTLSAGLADVGHVHIAQCPSRHCRRPGGPFDYRQLAPLLARGGYRGYIGHAFLPTGEVLTELAESLSLLNG